MKYSAETKAQAVAAVLGGASINATARALGMTRATVQKWVAASHITDQPTTAIQQKKVAIGEQLYGLLEEYIAYLRFEVRTTQNEEWIRKQDASSLAIYHGVISDKSVRLAAALRPPDVARPDDK